jgi:hypothetical protein
VATEKQFEFFRSLYEAENKRMALMQGHARDNLALATLYSAFLVFVMQNASPNLASMTMLDKALISLCVGAMMLSFLLSLLATRVTTVEIPTNPNAIIDGFGREPPSDSEFFDDRIADYVVAYERCYPINERKGRLLLVARYSLLVGILCHAGYFILSIIWRR